MSNMLHSCSEAQHVKKNGRAYTERISLVVEGDLL